MHLDINPQASLSQVDVSQEERNAFNSAMNQILSLSSNERHLKVFPYSHQSKYINTQKIPPDILVYEQSDDLTIHNLIYRYAEQKNETEQVTNIQFVMEGGTKLDRNKTIKQITQMLRLDSIDGLEVYIQKFQDFIYVNECSVQSMIQSEPLYNNKAIEVSFVLSDMKYIIYTPIEGEKQKNNKRLFQNVRDYISTEIQRVFGKIISSDMINLSFRQKQTEKQKINAQIKFGLLGKGDKVLVSFAQTVELPTLPHKNSSYLFIFGQGIKLNKFHYDDIKQKKLKDLLNQIELRSNWDQFGLKINDFVLKPEETFQKAHYFMNKQTMLCRYFFGQVISEALMFYAQQKRIKSLSSFNIEQIIDYKGRNLWRSCKEKAKEKAKNTSHIDFKQNQQSIKPILLYTSQLQVTQMNEKQPSTQYYSLNTFLRDHKFRYSTEESYKSWEYSFTNELLQQLKKIKPITNKVLWRGISHAADHKIGDIISFEQFISTSTQESQGRRFAQKTLFKITKSHSGKPVKQFSYHEKENEVIFEPYVQFKVKSIKTIARDQNSQQKIILIKVEEVDRPDMPSENALFLLWVDDKTKEGLQIWNSLSNIKKTSFMIPLLSTQELQNWLQKNTFLLQDKTAEFIMITNMTRKEGGIKKYNAGVEAIKVFRHFVPKGEIFVYIWQVQNTLEKLKDNKLIKDQRLKVSKIKSNLQQFLNQVGGLK